MSLERRLIWLRWLVVLRPLLRGFNKGREDSTHNSH
jgi:hypothetical protein